MSTFAIAGGQILLPHKQMESGAIIIENGKIAAVQPDIPIEMPVIDAQGGYILPGFIDLHLHGGGGADFMDGTVEAFHTVARTHCAHGTTAMTPTTVTCPDGELRHFFETYRKTIQEDAVEAEFLGIHLEGPYFSQASKGAQPEGNMRVPTPENMEQILSWGKGLISRWDAAPELPNMEMFARRLKKEGILCSIAHTNAVAKQAIEAFQWGFSHITHFYNAITTFRKIDQTVYAGVVEAAYINNDVTIELIGDGKHIPLESMVLAYQIKGPSQIALITDAMRAAGTGDAKSILGSEKSGVPVVIEEGVAKLPNRKSYAGSICTMDQVLRVAHLEYGLPLADIVHSLTLTPARLAGIESRKGSLETGKDADIVIMTPKFQVAHVFVRGKEFI